MSAPCATCGATVPEDARFCPSCGTRQPEAGAPAREVRKLVTILFADVSGSTALGERLDPEALRALMTRYFTVIRRVIERHGGTVEKFIGDAVMAVFGIPLVHEDDALRAVRAAAGIRDELATLNAELEVEGGLAVAFRTGIHTGEVVAGDPAGGTTLVTGDTVNTAARLEQAAPPGEILLGRLTWTLVRDAVDAEPVEPVAAKGKAEPIPAYRLLAVRPGAAGHRRRLDAPLVGRERELDRLEAAHRSAVADRACALFTLLGSAGVGKSRLVAEFLASVGDDALVLRGRCLSYGEGITYWPIGELVREAAGITETDDAGAARDRVRTLLAGARDAELLAARISSAIGLSDEPAPQEELFWAVRRLFEHLAVERPLIAVIEDIHWAEPTLLDLIEHVADWSRDAPILLLGTARPELLDARPAWGGGKLNATTLLLEPLGSDATARLIEALPGGLALPPPVLERVTAAAEGNPLYLEELLGMLVDDGLLTHAEDGTWVASPGLADVRVPPTVTALLAARLERLAPPERAVAERASVVGRVFERAAVDELAGDDLRPGVQAALLALVRKELLRPERGDLLTASDSYKFRHVLIRDAAYEALPKGERAVLHERFADWLEQTAGDRLAEVEEILGYHLEQAHRYRVELGDASRTDVLARRAADHFIAAGLRAESREDSGTAAALLEHGITLRADDTPDIELLRLRMANELSLSGRMEESLELVEAVGRRASAAGMAVAEARATTMALDFRAALQRPPTGSPEFDALAAAARPVVERSGDDLAIALLWRLMSTQAWDREDFLLSEEALEAAARFAERSGDRREILYVRTMVLVEELSGPTPLDIALASHDTLLAKPTINRDTQAYLLARRGLIRAMLGLEDGRRDVARSIELYLDLGRPAAAAESQWHMSWIERLAGDYEREEALLLEASVASWPTLLGLLSASRALALAKLGRATEASSALADSENDTWLRTVRTRRLAIARLAASSGDHATAEQIAASIEAEVIQQQYFLNARADLLVECGVIAALLGDREAMERRGREALDTARRKGNVALERKASALLAGDLSRL